MELTKQHIETIKREAAAIEFGKITVGIAGPPSNVVDIICEKRIRFQSEAEPTRSKPMDQKGSGRY